MMLVSVVSRKTIKNTGTANTLTILSGELQVNTVGVKGDEKSQEERKVEDLIRR
jgi:hypothetical protein